MPIHQKNIKTNQQGYIVMFSVLFVLIISASIILAMTSVIFYRIKISSNMVNSAQAYYAAEAGVEDALLKLSNNPQLTQLTYDLNVGGSKTTVQIPLLIGGSRALNSLGTSNGVYRTVSVLYKLTNGTNVNFYYGVNVGAGGVNMENGSEVMGNVFSNGNITGSGTIDNNAVVSGHGNSIAGVYVKGDAIAYSCLSGASVENLTYVAGGQKTCTVRGTFKTQEEEISQEPMPIPDSQIADWKNVAAPNTTTGDVLIKDDGSIGPRKIVGNLTVDIGVKLNLKGVLYVTGNIVFRNNANVKLDPGYSTTGGMIIADGTITLNNGDVFSGSGQPGSYIMLLSTSSSDVAIDVQNNAEGVVLYTTKGGITIHNNVSVTEATGYKVILKQNAKIQYSSGIVNIYFSSGPGAKWEVSNWQEQ
jgi:Tfp pilus assembly protein PilX